MRELLERYAGIVLSVLLGIGVFLFWTVGYPFALSYQEQYQLFLWTTDYFCERLSVAGGLADWLGDLMAQFYYVPWLGALLLTLLFVAVQRLVGGLWGVAVALLLLRLMGDESVLPSYVMALAGVLLLSRLCRAMKWYWDVLMVPAVYWLLGPMCWLYAALRVVHLGWRHVWMLAYLPLWIWVLSLTVMRQWPMAMVFFSVSYYRVPLQLPWLIAEIPAAVLLATMLVKYCPSRRVAVAASAVAAVAALLFVPSGYDKDKYELIRMDCLVRNEQWDEVIRRAEQHEVRTAFWSNCVNLALSQKRQLAERQFDFYQSGEDALIMERFRDLTSDLPSAEAFFRLGLVNSAQRYMFDIQESILNGKKSGRCTKRIVECMLINGHKKPARKYVDLLKKTLFYRGWAQEAERFLDNDALVDRHPVYGRLRQLRFKNDFLYSHAEKDKILGLLFMNNHDNKMALDYFIGEMLLRGDVQGVAQYMPWAEQYGGYRYMPVGYQDAARTIQSQGRAQGTKYGEYVRRMMMKKGGAE